ncbi:MAG: bi-domain-containing oxidoreductase [Candidatus Hydrogenedentes bacterium]|nr:bi-domain-containing oxidoreductase [Candidatus Hydrogenedentota bacterium]
MKQVLVRGGKVHVEDVPPPSVAPGHALVRVSHSVISSGTESSFVSEGGTAAFVMKNARNPLNVEKLKRKVASIGVRGTVEFVRGKLFEFQIPGYSTAGVVVECGEGLEGFRAGDKVACSGAGYACHAEYNLVPQQLLTPIPDGVDTEDAAFVTLGAIAMQGCRQLAPTFGETFVVMGMGLLGQLSAQILRAAGCRVICSDPVAAKRELATTLGASVVTPPEDLAAHVQEWTAGHGADGVLICAATKDSEAANSALELCRQKGRVVVTGAVGMNLARSPLYLKELDFRLSCSYGPGRYNPAYEEKGLDYPIGYVRWTEGRNMSEFLRMIAEGKVKVKPLISLRREVANAQDAYAAILDKESNTVAAVLTYGEPEEDAKRLINRRFELKARTARSGDVGVAVIGAGGFASAFHLPNVAKMSGARLVAVVNRTGAKAKQAAEKYGAAYCTTDVNQVLADDAVKAVIIATRHNLHAPLAIAAAKAGKHVFVEKPMAMTVPDCEAVCDAAESAGILLTVGFNRRFSKFAQLAKAQLVHMPGPKIIVYRCNAGVLPPGHWTNDPVEGGGRIIGEAVHFFDLCCWLAGQDPCAVLAERAGAPDETAPGSNNLTALIRFPDGSLATVIYSTLGHPGIDKEHIEVFGSGKAVVIDDFRGIRFAGLSAKNIKQTGEHKGQYEILENWIRAIRGEAELSVTAAHGLRATQIAQEAIRQSSLFSSPSTDMP